MKKIVYLLCSILALSFSVSSCQKGIPDTEEPTRLRTVNFIATINPETKTEIDGDHAVWVDSDADLFKVYSVYSTIKETGETEEKKYLPKLTKVTFSSDYSVANISATFEEKAGTFIGYDAVVAYKASNNGNPYVPAIQNPTESSYDPSSDVLAAKRISSGDIQNFQFVFNRPVSVNKMTLKGFENGERISKVLISTSDKKFAGIYQVATGIFTANSGDIECSFDNAVVNADGTFVVYFISGVGEYTPGISVTTDKNVYTKEFARSITFAANDLHSFSVNLAGCGEPISSTIEYTLVDNADDLFSGATYLIVGEKSGQYYAMGAQSTNNRSAVSIPSPVSNVIGINNTSSSPFLFKISETDLGWTIKDVTSDSDNNGQFLYAAGTATSKTNYLKSGLLSDNSYWTISFSNGSASIISINNDKTPYMQFNNSQNTLFSCYSSASQSPIYIYVDKSTCVEDTTPEIIVSGTALTFDSDGNTSDTDITVAGNVYLTSPISASIPEEAQDWLAADVEDGILVVIADANPSSDSRSTTITLSAEGAESVAISVSQEGHIVVSSNKYVKVTSTSDLADGKYLIVYEAGSVALNGALTADAAGNTVAVTISNGEIASTSAIDAAAVTYNAEKGSFLGGGGKYIGHTGSSNTLNYSDSALNNVVTFDEGNAVITAGNYVMRFNASSGQERFRYYKSGQQSIQLYKYVSGSSVPGIN